MSESAALDLSSLWEEHLRHEFETKNTEETLLTMVEDASVNHVPVMTGGFGKNDLREFYSTHFIPQMPKDTQIIPISRTWARIGSWRSLSSSSPMTYRWIGCFPASHRRERLLKAVCCCGAIQRG